MPSPAGRYTRSGLCDEVVDAGSFVGTSSISLAPPQAAGLVHSAAPPLKIAIALLDCDFVFFAHVGATLAFPIVPHTHSLSGQKAAHSGDTRLTAANGACCERVQGCKTVQGVTPLPSCSGKRQSHWSARRSERMPRFRFAIFSVRSEMPSCFASARTSSAGLGCVRNLRSSSSICMVFVCTCPVPFRMLSTVASQKPFH